MIAFYCHVIPVVCSHKQSINSITFIIIITYLFLAWIEKREKNRKRKIDDRRFSYRFDFLLEVKRKKSNMNVNQTMYKHQ